VLVLALSLVGCTASRPPVVAAPVNDACADKTNFDTNLFIKAMKPPVPEGNSDVIISADGCFHLQRKGIGGSVTDYKVVRQAGAKPLVMIQQTAIDGGFILQTDDDLDGFWDVQRTERSDSDGLILQEEIHYSPDTHEPTYRRTLTRGGPGKMHQKEEKLVAGKLKVTAEYDADAVQR
jgi:hypothetical protein